MNSLSTIYTVHGTHFEFARAALYGEEAQQSLEFAQQRNRAVTCSCGKSDQHVLSIRGTQPRLYLHRGRNPADVHFESCPHGPAPAGAEERGYSPLAVERSPDGTLVMEFGDLLSASVLEEVEDDAPRTSEGEGLPNSKPSLRTTVSLLGTLCWLLELSGLDACHPHMQIGASPWDLLDEAARSIRPRGTDGTWGLSDYLLLSNNHDKSRAVANRERLRLAESKGTGVLFAGILPFLLKPEQKYDLNLGVELSLSEAVVSRALKLRRNRFAAIRAQSGETTLILGRAYLRDGVAIADRIAVMPIFSRYCHAPVQSARELKRCQKAFDSARLFEARLSYDK